MTIIEGINKKPLRIGLLIDSFIVPKWIQHIINNIQTSSYAQIALTIKNQAAQINKEKKNFAQRIWQNRQHLLYALYTKFDESRVKVELDAFEPCSIEQCLQSCTVLEVTPIQKKFTDSFQHEDVQAIRSYELDVILRFGFRILKGEVLRAARYGIWSYHHGDGRVNRGLPPGFWEVMKGHPVTGTMLQVLTEELDSGKVIRRAWHPTTEQFSVKRHNSSVFWASCGLLTKQLRELYDCKDVELTTDASDSLYRPYYQRLYKRPTNREMVSILAGLSRRATQRVKEKTWLQDQWRFAYRIKTNAQDSNDAFFRFRELTPPKSHFWADPFPIKHEGRFYIFFEEATLSPERGHISVIEVDQKGIKQGPIKVLERDYHLSYPFVFKWQGHHYMIPETGSNRTVELYRCISFPDKWELEKVLLEDIAAYDATLFEDKGLWWMFVTLGRRGVTIPCHELHLFYAECPHGPWHPHKKNPVKLDARSSRPAGRLFSSQGILYRPAQNCSIRYGYAISLNRVMRLDLDEYREEEIWKILPEWKEGLVATHTLNSFEELAVIDYQVRQRRFF